MLSFRSNDLADAARFAESLKAKGTRRADPPDASHSRPCFGGHDGTLSPRASDRQFGPVSRRVRLSEAAFAAPKAPFSRVRT